MLSATFSASSPSAAPRDPVVLRLATRASPLALWQAGRVASLLKAAHPGLDVDVVTVTTRGDRTLEIPVWEMGGRGVFVREVQAVVTAGDADIAVHSAKDLQPLPTPGLRLAAVPERGDPRDALVGMPLSGLAPGAVIATGSQRRRAQLAALRPDLEFRSLARQHRDTPCQGPAGRRDRSRRRCPDASGRGAGRASRAGERRDAPAGGPRRHCRRVPS